MKNLPKITLKLLSAALSFLAFAAVPSQAAWELITDFETETEEDIYIWKRFPPGGSLYMDGVDPVDSSNRGLYMDPEEAFEGMQNIQYTAFPLPNGGVAQGATASLKWDFYAYGSAMQYLVGLSDVPFTVNEELELSFGRLLSPSTWNDYETVSRMRTTFDARDGNQYLISDINVPVGEWITIYQYIDNSVDAYELFYKTADDPEPVQLFINGQSSFSFRNGTDGPLVSIFLGVTKGQGDAWSDPSVVDNIYIDLSGRNPELPDSSGPVKTKALGLDMVEGYIDTGLWMGSLYADKDPYFWQPEIGSWVYIDALQIDTNEGTYSFFYYEDAPKFSDWGVTVGEWVDTGSFMGMLYFADSDWAYSADLSKWMTMPDPTGSQEGIWTWVTSDGDLSPTYDYEVTSATIAPTIDGTIEAVEWQDANAYALTYEALVSTGIGTSLSGLTGGAAEAMAYVTATAQGIYLGFEVTDADLYVGNDFGVSGAASDGIQVGFDMNPEPTARNSTVLFDFNPATLNGTATDGPPNVFARWGLTGYEEAWGVEIASTIQAGTGYTIEVMIPWSLLNSSGGDKAYQNDLNPGSLFRLTFAVVDREANGDARDILWDAGEGTFAIGSPIPYPVAVIVDPLQ